MLVTRRKIDLDLGFLCPTHMVMTTCSPMIALQSSLTGGITDEAADFRVYGSQYLFMSNSFGVLDRDMKYESHCEIGIGRSPGEQLLLCKTASECVVFGRVDSSNCS